MVTFRNNNNNNSRRRDFRRNDRNFKSNGERQSLGQISQIMKISKENLQVETITMHQN